MSTLPRRKTRADLEQRIVDLEAQLPYRHRAAMRDIEKAGEPLMASAAVLYVAALGGRHIVEPVAITNGLGKATIEAIKSDLQRSLDSITAK